VRYVDAIADRTGIGQAFAGMLLLGGITSLPEIAAVSGASQIATLSPAAITSVVPGAATLLQGALGIIALALTAAGIAVGEVRVLGVGAWSFVLFVFVVFSFSLASRYAKHSPWRADRSTNRTRAHPRHNKRQRGGAVQSQLEREPLAELVSLTAVLSVIILVAEFALSQMADALAEQTGLGSNYIGLVLVGFATALPNLSSIVAACAWSGTKWR
jgi:cation:H+ antiporter